MEDVEAELGEDGQEVVEDVALDALVFDPAVVVGEDVDLDRQAVFGGLQLPDEEGVVFGYPGMDLEVFANVGAEGAEVGQGAGIHGFPDFLVRELPVPLVEFLFLGVEVVAQEADFAEPFDGGCVEQAHGIHVEQEVALDPADPGFAHSAPVAEAVADQGIGGNGGDGFVEVLHLDGGEGDIDHVAVGAEFRHFDPVAPGDHPVCGQLHARDEPEDGVLENEHHHGGQRAETAEDQHRRFSDDRGYDKDRSRHEEEDFEDLDEALDGDLARDRKAPVNAFTDVEHRVQRQDGADNDVDLGEDSDDVGGCGIAEHRLPADPQHHAGDQLGDPAEDPAVDEFIVPGVFGPFDRRADQAHHDAQGDEIDGKRGEQHQQQHQGVRQDRNPIGAADFSAAEPPFYCLVPSVHVLCLPDERRRGKPGDFRTRSPAEAVQGAGNAGGAGILPFSWRVRGG